MDDKRFNGKHKTAHTRSPKLQAYPFLQVHQPPRLTVHQSLQ
jgi:hypothetical protein